MKFRCCVFPKFYIVLVLMAVGASLAISSCQGTSYEGSTPTLIITATAQPSATPQPSPTVTPQPSPTPSPTPAGFDGQRALADVNHQVSLGPRTPGSPGHDAIVRWMQDELTQAGWEVEIQESRYQNHAVRNVIAKRGSGKKPWVLLGAHYDTRMQASEDPDPTRRQDPVPGANDGASGVAVLVELARVLPPDLDQQVWLAFVDVEDQGNLPGWEWIIGSSQLAESIASMPEQPQAVIIVDMVGDADLNLPMERNSNQALLQEIWSIAAELGYQEIFLQRAGYSMMDDHTPFLNRGMTAVDIIDFDYPYWHTVADTPDKVSAESLHAVGDTLYHWLTRRSNYP